MNTLYKSQIQMNFIKYWQQKRLNLSIKKWLLSISLGREKKLQIFKTTKSVQFDLVENGNVLKGSIDIGKKISVKDRYKKVWGLNNMFPFRHHQEVLTPVTHN